MKISNKVGYLRNWACSSHGDLKQEILGIVHIFGKGSLQHFSECIISKTRCPTVFPLFSGATGQSPATRPPGAGLLWPPEVTGEALNSSWPAGSAGEV